MNVREVTALARKWVDETGSALPGFHGAYLAGSINDMAPDDPFPSFKDVDIYVVVEDLSRIAVPQEKFLYEGHLLESACKSLEEHRSPESILASPYAGSVATCTILSDPTGLLAGLRTEVAEQFALPRWIAARCEGQKMLIANLLAHVELAPDPVYFLGFHVMFLGGLVALASGGNPTARRCLARSGELLAGHGRPDLHEEILGLLGCADMDRSQVVGHLQDCVAAFDRAVDVLSTPFYASWNIHPATRRYLVDGAYEMIDAGQHREAMFWIATMHSLASIAIRNDAPEAEKNSDAATMERLRTALGVPNAAAWRTRLEVARSVSERVTHFADEVVARSA